MFCLNFFLHPVASIKIRNCFIKEASFCSRATIISSKCREQLIDTVVTSTMQALKLRRGAGRLWIIKDQEVSHGRVFYIWQRSCSHELSTAWLSEQDQHSDNTRWHGNMQETSQQHGHLNKTSTVTTSIDTPAWMKEISQDLNHRWRTTCN